MIRLLIIADDFTGALDTGVQFAMEGACTRVITRPQCDMAAIDPQVNVLVVDAETRHLPAQEAYDIVHALARQAVALGVPYIFKKTDSALRGNIGAELTAVLDASGAGQMPFLPAFPQMNRKTVAGVHYIADMPVSESVFGIDPFEPVRSSRVTELIALQSKTRAASHPAVSRVQDIPQERGIVVYDTQSEQELTEMAACLHEGGCLRVMAGCAGLGAVLPRLLGLCAKEKPTLPLLDGRMLVLCGSVNPITVAQLQYAQENGFLHLHIHPEQKLTPGYFDTDEGREAIDVIRRRLKHNPCCIIDANDADANQTTAAYAKAHGLTVSDLRIRIANALGAIMRQLFDCPDVGTMLITGGDTLLQCMNSVGVYEMEPVGELYSGVVLSRFALGGCERYVISKSGGFGEKTLLCDLKKRLSDEEERTWNIRSCLA